MVLAVCRLYRVRFDRSRQTAVHFHLRGCRFPGCFHHKVTNTLKATTMGAFRGVVHESCWGNRASVLVGNVDFLLILKYSYIAGIFFQRVGDSFEQKTFFL